MTGDPLRLVKLPLFHLLMPFLRKKMVTPTICKVLLEVKVLQRPNWFSSFQGKYQEATYREPIWGFILRNGNGGAFALTQASRSRIESEIAAS